MWKNLSLRMRLVLDRWQAGWRHPVCARSGGRHLREVDRFLALVSSAIVLMLLTGTIAYCSTGNVLEALRSLGEGLTRMRTGD